MHTKEPLEPKKKIQNNSQKQAIQSVIRLDLIACAP